MDSEYYQSKHAGALKKLTKKKNITKGQESRSVHEYKKQDKARNLRKIADRYKKSPRP